MIKRMNETDATRLRRERELRGWSQAELARRIGAPDKSVVGRWERGEVSPSPHYRARLCELFELDAEEFGWLDPSPGADDPATLPAGYQERRLPARMVSTGLKVLALLVFSLPFVTASCGDRQIASLKGTDLALGTDLGPGFGSSSVFGIDAGRLPADPWTLLVLLLPLAGIAVVWLGTRLDWRLVAASIAAVGAVGSVRLLALLARIHAADDAARRQTGNVGHVDAAFGLYLALVVFAAIAGWGVWCLWRGATQPFSETQFT
jgi:transcriptional regulator with XRE-family HTH domain